MFYDLTGMRHAPTMPQMLRETKSDDLQKNCLTTCISSGAKGMNEESKELIPCLLDAVVRSVNI
jgi:hypothetical protein